MNRSQAGERLLGTAERQATTVAFGALGVVTVRFLIESVPSETLRANLALVLVLPILTAAAAGGRTAARATAVVASLNLAVEHRGPGGPWELSDVGQLLPAALLISIGLLAGEVIGPAIGACRSRQEHLELLDRIGRVTDANLSSRSFDEFADLICREIAATLHLQDCWYEAHPATPVEARLTNDGLIDQGPLRHHHGGFELPSPRVEIALREPGNGSGRIVLIPTPGQGTSLQARVAAALMADHLSLRRR